MELRYILIFTLISLVISWLRLRRYAGELLLIISALTIFWLQPLSPVRNMAFWLPTASISLTVFIWAATYPEKKRPIKQIVPGLFILLFVIFAIGASRYSQQTWSLGLARPPEFISVLYSGLFILITAAILYFFTHIGKSSLPLLLMTLIVFFIVMKEETLGRTFSAWLRELNSQQVEMAASSDLFWLGYSFLAFRLIGVVRDRQLGRLPASSLTEFATYALFFPAVISGPIDRLQHFTTELRQMTARLNSEVWRASISQNTLHGLERILSGLIKKIIIADNLAYFALNSQNASQISETGWAWLLLLAYTFRIYFDFAGYTDIALGIARLMGISLPENFNHPYLKQNLTAFWNSWHITLTQWVRGYVFYPLTRFLRRPTWSLPTWSIILVGQVFTMMLIGLWHGITWNFLIWGLWHAVGLFVQNRWSSWLPTRFELSRLNSAAFEVLRAASWLLTFLYISIGWVFFALPNPGDAWKFLAILLGNIP